MKKPLAIPPPWGWRTRRSPKRPRSRSPPAARETVHSMAESNREELGALLRRIEEVRGLAPGAVAHESAAHDDPSALVPVLARLVDDVERSHRRLIEANVQLVSLREVASSLTATRDAGEATRLVARYLRGALGFEQVGLLLVDSERGVLTGTWAWSGGVTAVEVPLTR